MRILFLSLFFFNTLGVLKAQDVHQINFNSLDAVLRSENDTTYVINFWATWCKPCVEELPAFEKLNTESKGKKIKVILISMDMQREIDTKLKPFILKNNMHSTIWWLSAVNANDWIDKVSADWSGAVPATIIYKNQKKRFFEKSFTYDELKAEVGK